MKKTATAVLFAALFAGSTASAVDDTGEATDMQALQRSVRADKRAYVAATLKLTEAEAKKFWPLYTAYQRELDSSNRRRVIVLERLIALDKPLSELYAKNLANELLASDEAELKARRTLHTRLMRTLPPRKATRYLQLESKIRAANAYNVAATIPLLK